MKTSLEFAASERPSQRYVPSGVHRIELGVGASEEAKAQRSSQPIVAAEAPIVSDATQRAEAVVSSAFTSADAGAQELHEGLSADAGEAVAHWAGLTNSPRWRLFASASVVVTVSVSALIGRLFVHSAWGCALVSLSPLLLLVSREHRATRSLYAGILWVALAWTQLVHPVAAAATRTQQLLALSVLAGIFLSLRHSFKSMQELSRRDPLTGLLNRRGFEEFGVAELRRAARYGRPITFALLDVDRFKQINDRYGHATGDRVLQVVAEQLRELRNSDLAVRLGGDEFGLLMPETDAAGAELLIARLLQRIDERMREQGWPVTVSIGIAQAEQLTHAHAAHAHARRESAQVIDELVAAADSHMYEAKSSKRALAQ